MKRILYSSIIFLILNNNIFSQNIDEQCNRLQILFDSLFVRDDVKYLKTDSEKNILNDSILKIFNNILQIDESFNNKFDNLKHIGKVISNDNLCRLITWNIKYSNGSFKYFGFVQFNNIKKNKIQTFNLCDLSDSIKQPEIASLSYNNWYGVLYYNIYNYKYKNKNFYILFGWDGNNYYTNKKIIDILTFNNNGKPIFGKPVFKIENKIYKRLIFEFSIKATMTCNYNSSINAIVFDHLSPENKSKKGLYQFYGPDGTFDGLKLEKDKWVLFPNINVTNPKPTKK